MRSRRAVGILLLILLLGASCAGQSAASLPSLLQGAEQVLLQETKDQNGFRRFWRLAPSPALGLIQWDEDRSASPPSAPADLLQAIRDELGRVNQVERRGGSALVACNIYRYKSGGLLGKTRVGYEIVGRTKAGTLLWAGDDEVSPSPELQISLADSDSALLARAIAKKLRTALGL